MIHSGREERIGKLTATELKKFPRINRNIRILGLRSLKNTEGGTRSNISQESPERKRNTENAIKIRLA